MRELDFSQRKETYIVEPDGQEPEGRQCDNRRCPELISSMTGKIGIFGDILSTGERWNASEPRR